MKVRKLVFIALVCGALIAAFVIARVLPEKKKNAPAQPAASTASPGGRGGGAPLPVYTYDVQARALQERITATGTLVADESVALVSEVAGKIVSIAFQEGARVSRGDVLVKIDDSDLRAQLARARSRVDLARVQAQRQEQLGVGVGTTHAAYDAAANEVRVFEAEAELVRTQLAKTEIRAPFDGQIGLRYVSQGAYVTPTAHIASLQKVDPIKVEFAVAERYLEQLKRDAEVRIAVAGLEEPFVGQVYAIEPQIDVTTRTLRLRARAPNPSGKALPGGFATVELPLREIPNALMVPADALVAGLNQQQVYVVQEGRAQVRTVQIGIRLAREVQIVSGLKPGDVVITSGQLQLRPNMPVKPVPRERAAAATAAGAASMP